MKIQEWVDVLNKKSYEQIRIMHNTLSTLHITAPEVFNEFEGLETVRQLTIRAIENHGAEE